MSPLVRLIAFIALTGLAVLLPSTSFAVAADNCHSCHGRKGMPTHVDKVLYEGSVHGKLSCSVCHTDIASYPHGKVSRVNCTICHFTGDRGAPKVRDFKFSVHGKALAKGNSSAPDCQTCHGSHTIYPVQDERSGTARLKIPALCSRCHPEEYEDYRKSIHGKMLIEGHNQGAATCFDCHMEHLIPKTDEERWKLELVKQCGRCHTGQMDTYRKTFHGKVTRLGYTTVAKCQDCHGAHAVLATKDPGSTVSPANILNTCRGGNCHPQATVSFTKYYAHAEESNRAKYPLLYYVYVLMTTLLIGVFSFFFLHTFLWAYRALMERAKRGKEDMK
jgi:hypothetical protein